MRRVISRALVVVGLVVAPLAVTWGSSTPTASAAVDVTGASPETAAGSCWEIKQTHPGSTDGDYWLLTPTMAEPAQFYCDMTTDGGGWVLIGKGRDGWTHDYDGKGAAADLLTPTTTPMSSTTVQLGSDSVDALLNGARVDSLADGVRLLRARDVDGTVWQEGRVKYSKFGHWAWTLAAAYPVASWSFGGVSGTGGTSTTFGSNQVYKRATLKPSKANGYKRGFAYGTSVVGSSSPTSYLWSATDAGGALPYTEVFLRPRVLSTDAGFTSIPDGGTAAHAQQSVAKSQALASPWGVSGLAGNTAQEGSVEVQAFTQSGNTMYVGGNFKYVEQDAAGTGRVAQPFLAAFDVSTGEYLPAFRPVLNEQVHALATLPDGSVVAGGEFTTANGKAATGIVALDPTTGATDPRFNVTLKNTLDSVRVNALTVGGRYLYIGGAITHLAGGTRPTTFVYTRGLGRVMVEDGTAGPHWKPSLNGSVKALSVSPDLTRLYAVGYFSKAGSTAVSRAAAFVTAYTGELVTPAWTPTWSSKTDYQQAVDAVGSKVWVGGSQHSLFQFDSTTLKRTMGDIFDPHGDIQAITDTGNVIYAGCHCNDYDYHNAYAWPTLTTAWTEVNAMRWFGAWDATTGNRIPQFTPNMSTRAGSGVWAIKSDSTGVTWAGGDLLTARTSSKAAAFAGGFARFPLNDSTPPPAPTDLRVTAQDASTATLSWTGSDDAADYVVLRDDRPIAITTSRSAVVPLGGENRFFVRAVDREGNYSASTPMVPAS